MYRLCNVIYTIENKCFVQLNEYSYVTKSTRIENWDEYNSVGFQTIIGTR